MRRIGTHLEGDDIEAFDRRGHFRMDTFRLEESFVRDDDFGTNGRQGLRADIRQIAGNRGHAPNLDEGFGPYRQTRGKRISNGVGVELWGHVRRCAQG